MGDRALSCRRPLGMGLGTPRELRSVPGLGPARTGCHPLLMLQRRTTSHAIDSSTPESCPPALELVRLRFSWCAGVDKRDVGLPSLVTG
jgi:hypothetical protein